MKKSRLLKAMGTILTIALAVSLLLGSVPAMADTAVPEGKTKVVFWYLWSGDTVARIDKIVETYNAQSEQYFVEALSVPDSQKVIVAISAGNGPDLTDDFSSNVGKFAGVGVMEPLDDYIAKTGFALDDFVPAAVESCRMDGKLYAMPLNINFMGLYYNKTLLKEAGYDAPPKTMEELYEMAVKTTKVNADGSLDVCGFPDFPSVYYMDSFQSAAGGGWYNEDGGPASASNEGNAYALKLLCDYRTQFGVDKVVQFGAGGKYLDPTDPFLMGKQTFRIDGPWMGKDIKVTFKSDVDYGVTFVPYPEAHPEYEHRAGVSSSVFFVSSTSKNKEGAFDFLTYLIGEQGMVDFTVAGGDFPSRISTMQNEAFLKGFDVDFYTQMAHSDKLVSVPAGAKNGEYMTMVNEQIELCMNLKQDIPTTLKNIEEKGLKILK
ncbi:MAG: ABC transporter substrate-binding protein [Clostridia bacterium]